MKKLLLTIALAASLAIARPQEYPNFRWHGLNSPAAAGWDTARLSRLKHYLIDSTAITAFLLVRDEKIVLQYGDIEENSYLASCRKSILSILYGTYVQSGEIRLDQTLQGLGLDDKGGLLPLEKQATIKDILSARSGVFHPASYPGDDLLLAPPRGSVRPGSYWLYSNWDFNVAGAIFEQLTHRDIYDEIEEKLAVPLHMQDWKRDLQRKEGDTSRSVYAAYPVYFSARDMARIGQLLLNGGRWGGRQLVPQPWITAMLQPETDYTEVDSRKANFKNLGYSFGYGLMWWLWQNVKDKRFEGAYSAFGNMGQTITVLPAIQTVIVYKTKSDYERETPVKARLRVLTLAGEALQRP